MMRQFKINSAPYDLVNLYDYTINLHRSTLLPCGRAVAENTLLPYYHEGMEFFCFCCLQTTTKHHKDKIFYIYCPKCSSLPIEEIIDLKDSNIKNKPELNLQYQRAKQLLGGNPSYLNGQPVYDDENKQPNQYGNTNGDHYDSNGKIINSYSYINSKRLSKLLLQYVRTLVVVMILAPGSMVPTNILASYKSNVIVVGSGDYEVLCNRHHLFYCQLMDVLDNAPALKISQIRQILFSILKENSVHLFASLYYDSPVFRYLKNCPFGKKKKRPGGYYTKLYCKINKIKWEPYFVKWTYNESYLTRGNRFRGGGNNKNKTSAKYKRKVKTNNRQNTKNIKNAKQSYINKNANATHYYSKAYQPKRSSPKYKKIDTGPVNNVLPPKQPLVEQQLDDDILILDDYDMINISKNGHVNYKKRNDKNNKKPPPRSSDIPFDTSGGHSGNPHPDNNDQTKTIIPSEIIGIDRLSIPNELENLSFNADIVPNDKIDAKYMLPSVLDLIPFPRNVADFVQDIVFHKFFNLYDRIFVYIFKLLGLGDHAWLVTNMRYVYMRGFSTSCKLVNYSYSVICCDFSRTVVDSRQDHQRKTDIKHKNALYYWTLVKVTHKRKNLLEILLGPFNYLSPLNFFFSNMIMKMLVKILKTIPPLTYNVVKRFNLIFQIFGYQLQSLPVELIKQIGSADSMPLNNTPSEVWTKINRTCNNTFTVNTDKNDILRQDMGTYNATLASFVLYNSIVNNLVFRLRPSHQSSE